MLVFLSQFIGKEAYREGSTLSSSSKTSKGTNDCMTVINLLKREEKLSLTSIYGDDFFETKFT